MPKKAPVVTKEEVESWVAEKKVGKHPVGGVAGVYLQIQPSGSACWVLRRTMGKRRREMGLGGYPEVSLVKARTKAAAEERKLLAGSDPIEEAARKRATGSSERVGEAQKTDPGGAGEKMGPPIQAQATPDAPVSRRGGQTSEPAGRGQEDDDEESKAAAVA